ncbi:MAG: hypothetical protein DRP28_02925 [Thermodesulfobacteriota bacterium]|nr:MAG: hypothetical protein DRP28_02925 [Thermodesulfobacteriota bacterium]
MSFETRKKVTAPRQDITGSPDIYPWTVTILNSKEYGTLKIPFLKLVEKIDLPNNLVLEFYDYSRVVAGDRWFVGLLARIPIEISEEDFAGRPRELCEDFLKEHGTVIYFELKKERNFIDEREKDRILNQLLNDLKEYALSYMGHKSFAKGFIRRQIQAFEERWKWQKAIT